MQFEQKVVTMTTVTQENKLYLVRTKNTIHENSHLGKQIISSSNKRQPPWKFTYDNKLYQVERKIASLKTVTQENALYVIRNRKASMKTVTLENKLYLIRTKYTHHEKSHPGKKLYLIRTKNSHHENCHLGKQLKSSSKEKYST